MAGAFWMSALAIGTSTVKQYNIIVALIDLCTGTTGLLFVHTRL